MHIRRHLIIPTLFAAMTLAATAFAAGTESVPRMSTDELKSRLGEPGLVVLDARGSWDWDGATEKIAGSVRVDPAAVEQWAGNYDKEKTIVVYCA
jgi:rhodanese-related sulfurtransferase